MDSEDRVLSRRFRSSSMRNDDIAEWVEGCLSEAGAGFSSLKSILVGIGPGSFTGIRIAMAFAQGLAFPHDLPMHGFTSFSALLLSHASREPDSSFAVIPANSGRFYVAQGLKDAGALLEPEALRQLGGEKKTILVHEDSASLDSVRSAFGEIVGLGDGLDLPALARHARTSGKGAHQPYYLQSPAAEIRLAAP